MKRLKIGYRLLIGFGICILLIGIYGVYVSFQINNIKGSIYNYEIVQNHYVEHQKLQTQIANIWYYFTEASLTRDKDVINIDAGNEYSKTYKTVKLLKESYNDFNSENGFDKKVSDYSKKLDVLKKELEEAWLLGMEMYKSYGASETLGNIINEKFDERISSLVNKTEELTKSIKTQADDLLNHIITIIGFSILFTIISGSIIIIIAVLLSIIISRSITKPINEFSTLFLNMASGDLTNEYPINYVNCSELKEYAGIDCSKYNGDKTLCFFEVGSYAKEFGKDIDCSILKSGKVQECSRCKIYRKVAGNEIDTMGAWLNKFISNIKGVVDQIKGQINQTWNISSKLVTMSETMSKTLETIKNKIVSVQEHTDSLDGEINNTNQFTTNMKEAVSLVYNQISDQTTAITESSSSIEEMSASINSISEVSKSKLELAKQLEYKADEGEQEMNRSIDLIRQVTESAGVIFELIDVIKGIAKRTNLLAMNASIEAAHVGEAGKGFAVVADEIRKLSEETSINSKNISESLKQVIDRINITETTTIKTGERFGELMKVIRNMANSMKEINNGTSELNVSSLQINKTLSKLISLSEQINSQSDDMNDKTGNIKTSMRKVNDFSIELKEMIKVIVENIKELNQSGKDVAQIGLKNLGDIDELEKLIAQFKTEKSESIKRIENVGELNNNI